MSERKTFGQKMRYFRRNSKDPDRGGALTQERLVDLLAKETGEEISITKVSRWENDEIKINHTDRGLLVSIIQIFSNCNGLKTIAEADEFLNLGGYRHLDTDEIALVLTWHSDIDSNLPDEKNDLEQRKNFTPSNWVMKYRYFFISSVVMAGLIITAILVFNQDFQPETVTTATNTPTIQIEEEGAMTELTQTPTSLPLADETAQIRDCSLANESSANEHRGQGFSALIDKNYEDAISCYTQAIVLDGGTANDFIRRGIAYMNLPDNDAAISDFGEAIQRDDTNTEALNLQGAVYINMKEYELAIASFSNAILLEPENGLYYNNRGVAYVGDKQTEQAIADYEMTLVVSEEPGEREQAERMLEELGVR